MSGDGISESTPVIQKSDSESERDGDLEKGTDPRSPRATKKQRISGRMSREARERADKIQQRFESRMKIVICCCLSLIVSFIVAIVYFANDYYKEVYSERKIIDEKHVVVSEKWMDYTTGEQVNCTNMHTCSDWNCKYVTEHFHKHLDECAYDDNVVIITALIILTFVCCICNMINDHC